MDSEASISNLVNRHLISINSNAKSSAAIKLLTNSNVDMLPVLENGKLVGIFTKDSSNNDLVSSSMEKALFVEKNQDIDSTIKYMLKHNISRVPVVDSAISMKCIGTISSSDLLKIKKNQK
ncbi:MAG: CBS domain-containing protein [Candidatus Micrarchaeaceae archaeon]|jgi:predicted transcriptional regulator